MTIEAVGTTETGTARLTQTTSSRTLRDAESSSRGTPYDDERPAGVPDLSLSPLCLPDYILL